MTGATTLPTGGPADAIAATQRVLQLQTLIAQARQGASPASFAAALDAASTPPTTASAAGEGVAPASAGAPPTIVGAAPAGAVLPPTNAALPPTNAALPPAGASASPGAGAPVAGSGGSAYDAPIAQAAARYNLDPALLHGLIQQESGFDPNSRSSAGALGLTQLMPSTAASLGVANPLDPVQSIEGGARYLSEMLGQFGGNTADALAAYNAGPGAVRQYGGVPPYAETQDYVTKVLGYAEAYRQTHATAAPSGRIA